MKQLKSLSVPHHKNTAYMPARRMDVPAFVNIPMSMNIGPPSKPVVSAGKTVKVGQLIAEAGGYVGAPIHSSVSGKVKKIGTTVNSMGQYVPLITIETDGLQEPYEGLAPPDVHDFKSFIQAVADCGAVGLGGASFPTMVKLNIKSLDQCEVIIVNAAECEPYNTSDTSTLFERGDEVFEGILLLKKYMQAKQIIIAIEDINTRNIESFKERIRTSGVSGVELRILPSTYPQGAEKVLIYNTTGRIVMEGKLPIDAGAIVINCTTLAVIAHYIRTGMPLVEKTVTVDGSAVKEPANIIAPIGTALRDLYNACGGFKEEPKKVLYGGPMMGIAVPDLDQPVLKSTNATLAFNEKDARIPEQTACIRCGKCIDVCPFNLMPVELYNACENRNCDMLRKLKVNLCMECGCCAYVCPAKRELVESNKLGKALVRADDAKKKAAVEEAAARAAAKAEAEQAEGESTGKEPSGTEKNSSAGGRILFLPRRKDKKRR
ncbi:MAG: electron transport complex subunit RsxC [Lachnospiraceae bacterium]|nr:electron transport complex subunit RsxC [Lachnospiraceae bacterium]